MKRRGVYTEELVVSGESPTANSIPERRLLLSVLAQAIHDTRGQAPPGIRAEATMWIQSRETRLFSFIWVCETLGLDPPSIAAGIFSDKGLDLLPILAQSRGRFRHNHLAA